MRGEVGGLRAEMDARFEGMDTRFDYLDDDVAGLSQRVFGGQK